MKHCILKQVILGLALTSALGCASVFAAGPRTSTKAQKLSPGAKVKVRNQSGPITVEGWDQDTVQATADGSDQPSDVTVQVEGAGLCSISPNMQGHPHRGEVRLVIKMPRSASIDSLSTGRGSVQVTNISGSVTVTTGNGDLRITQVGPLNASTSSGDIQVRSVAGDAKLQSGNGDISLADVSGAATVRSSGGGVTATRTGRLFVHTNNGDVNAASIDGSAALESDNGGLRVKDVKGNVLAKMRSGDFKGENISGLINLAITSGSVRAVNIGGDAKVIAISSDIDIKCLTGSAELATISGSITLAGIGGNVSASSTSGDVTLAGNLLPKFRYKLKSVSGDVSLLIPPDTGGFTATLSSYSGEIETDFPLKLDSSIERGPVNRRVIGHFGDGQADVGLDSFSGTAKIAKLTPGRITPCK